MRSGRYLKGLVAAVMLTAAWGAQAGGNYADGADSAVRGDYRAAFDAWESLAESGDARAQFNLGLMYHGGLFVEQNEAKALGWYQRAAENGVPEAQQFLVVAYTEGWFGLAKNLTLAQYWSDRLSEEVAR